MSVNREIKSVRCEDLLTELVKGGHCVFFTLTTKDVVDYAEIRARWRCLRHDLCRALGGARYVMNYEIHPKGHGWHIHGVFDRFVPLDRFLPLIHRHGFGRVDFRRVGSVGVANYLTKHCLKAYRGVKMSCASSGSRLRLVNTSRGLPRLQDYCYKSEYLDRLRMIGRDVFCHVRASRSFRPVMFWASLAADLGFSNFDQARSFVIEKFYGACVGKKLDDCSKVS